MRLEDAEAALQADTHSAGVSAGNKNILTTGRDNTLRLYDQSMSQQCSVPHNNNTGRWVMPLRATLGPSDTIICGSMKRAVRFCQQIPLPQEHFQYLSFLKWSVPRDCLQNILLDGAHAVCVLPLSPAHNRWEENRNSFPLPATWS